ncbi:non-classical export protein 1 [Panacibacter sp. DH6]|uniref:Non-classical export protein 1 n=1 Tax=Panacibacter microcysteis TaxID=2793269 RepID=A0A931MEQ5_9BACT|nr:non-classical export protein 1 [Panacibacter microcysteis]MBG9378414.1 non-classical export protein 1 [Panacibacter microcysteis]
MGIFLKAIHDQNTRLSSKYSDRILKLFIGISSAYIYEKREARKPNTNTIKYNLVKLGHELGFRVYANGLTSEQSREQFEKYGFVNREFLYDVHWYVDKKGEFYTPEDVPLVVESELGDRRKNDTSKLRSPAIKFDFQKLLFANADLRLMIFKTKNLQHLNEINLYFEKAIESFRLLEKGSAFLFICFVHDTKELYYSEKNKQ